MLNNAEGLYQRLQGPPFQPPVIRKRLDPECGGCALAAALTGGQLFIRYI